jgi:sortase A
MANHVYKKTKKKDKRKIGRFVGLVMLAGGLLVGLYIFFPLISWQLYLEPAFASTSYASPIPKNTIITKNYLKSLINNTADAINGVNYDNASNWLPPQHKESQPSGNILSYSISIPKLNIENADVSTTDTDLNSHLVHFPGTAVPPSRGTAAIFGHSTLPQLYDRKNYKTIFANIHELSIGDTIIVSANNTLYTYKIYAMEITDPEDTSYLTQSYDSSYLDIVTCTPPGTTWKRLIVKTRLENS